MIIDHGQWATVYQLAIANIILIVFIHILNSCCMYVCSFTCDFG